MQLTHDSLLQGRLTLWQPARGQGYRFNLDPVLLAGFCSPGEHVVDLGAGCGVVGLLLVAMGKAERLTAVELQPDLAELIRRNAADNGLADRVDICCDDVRSIAAGSLAADRIVFNAPYFRANHGRNAQSSGRDRGRHERHGTLADFVACSVRCSRAPTRIAAIVRAERGAEIRAAFDAASAGLTRQRPVLSRTGGRLRHVLVEATPAAATGACRQEPALIVHQERGRDFSDEVAGWLRGDGAIMRRAAD